MEAELDKKSGFCFGVSNAVNIAEEALKNGEKVYSLGPIVHNDREVERLRDLGLISINHDQFAELKNSKVLIRAHGEPPSTYRKASENNITIIEATCPIVKKLQSRIHEAWERSKTENGQVVIFGKAGHAEVVGLCGQTSNQAILVSGKEDLSKIDFSRPVQLFSQTTMSPENYSELAAAISSGMKEAGSPESYFKAHNTICGQVSNREPHLREFARKHDIIIFVSGSDSSNGKMLYAVCREINPDTYFVSSPEELHRSWFEGKRSAGVCGATSTPKWLIEKIYDIIREF
jgi:4-hydroxy-3-methylbut-2-enyl diphosphate reductase